MDTLLARFLRDKDGAMTADYVMLVAALIAVAFSGSYAIRAGAFDGIRDILDVVDTANGCTTTSETGVTDLSQCQ